MPLHTFSRILSSKSPAATPKKTAPQSQPPSGSSKPSPLMRFYSRRRDHEPPSPSPSKPKEPRTFNFSFDRMNLFGSLRGRTKVAKTESRPSSGTIFNDISYSGYEDEEYGEPQAEAEEIRRPSGLGRRASIAEEKIHVSDLARLAHVEERDRTRFGIYEEDASGALEADAFSEASHESDGEELAEIRYPSGLGNFKPVISTFDPERPRSTYPIFEAERPAIKRGMSMPELSASASGTSPPHHTGLSKVIPLLAPYLSRRTLYALTLVDKAAAEASRQYLWKNIALEVTLLPRGTNRANVVAHTSLNLLDTLSTQPELAHMVKSLELHCCRDARMAPKSSRRHRPPSLTLSFDPLSFLKSDSKPPTPSQLAKRYSAPPPRENDFKLSPVLATRAASSTNGDDERATVSNKARRASSFIPSSLSLKANFPEAWKIASAKLPPPSTQPARPLFKRRSLTFTVPSTSQTQFQPKSPSTPPSGATETPPSSSKLLPPGSSNWTPPAEWGWTPHEHRRHLSSGPSSAQDPSPSSVSPPPNTGGSAPHSWIAASSTASERRAPLSKSSLPSLKTGLHAASPSKPSPRLKSYPSLPSFRVPYTPTSPGFMANSAYDDLLTSPVTSVPSPITPHSPVSLSAFPLPPQTLTPSSTPMSLQFSPSWSGHEKPDTFPSSPLSTDSSRNTRFLQGLVSASTNMIHLTHVTVLFVLAPSSESSPPISGSFTHRPRSYGHDGDPCDIDVIIELRDSLMKMKSLKSVKVVCPAGQEAFHRVHWSLLKDKLDDFDVEVMCVP